MCPMGRMGLCSGLAAAALVVGGCGSVATDDPQAVAGGSTTRPAGPAGGAQGDGTAVDPLVEASDGPVFPLTVRRTGGIAGYDDTVVLRADGQVLVDTASVHGRVCTLSKPLQRQILGALGTLDLLLPTGASEGDGEAGAETAGVPDEGGFDDATDGSNSDGPASRIAISVADVHRRPVDLRPPSVGSIATMVSALVSDVTLTAPAVTACRTPRPAQSQPAPLVEPDPPTVSPP